MNVNNPRQLINTFQNLIIYQPHAKSVNIIITNKNKSPDEKLHNQIMHKILVTSQILISGLITPNPVTFILCPKNSVMLWLVLAISHLQPKQIIKIPFIAKKWSKLVFNHLDHWEVVMVMYVIPRLECFIVTSIFY